MLDLGSQKWSTEVTEFPHCKSKHCLWATGTEEEFVRRVQGLERESSRSKFGKDWKQDALGDVGCIN